MVRLKNRYLLVNILYPELDDKAINAKVPDVVKLNQPTTNSLTPGALVKGLRAEIATLFGDYGSGAVADSLSVKYLSPATSTFILRISRAHYKMAWAALSLMNNVPVQNGKKCVFRVIRVSGTIRKAEEEAIRRAREMVVLARREAGEHSDSLLDSMFGGQASSAKEHSTKDFLMVDASDSEDDEEMSDGDG